MKSLKLERSGERDASKPPTPESPRPTSCQKPKAPVELDTEFVAIAALALGFWRLSLNGLGNGYYTAADISGAHSMRNLFFSAFDRSGIMAVDKPPLGLVAPALAVRLFGLSSWTILGPQVVLFAAGILILHTALRRWFNRRVAVIASIVLLVTPIDIAVARSNNPDEMLVLLTIVGLVVVTEALRGETLRWVVATGIVLGLAFTTKQLQAVITVPAILFALMFLAPGTWKRRILRVTVFAAVASFSCLAWIEVVDHVSPSDRPYVANSTNNTELQLAFGFNGAHRVEKIQTRPTTSAHPDSFIPDVARSLAGEARLTRNLFGARYARQGSWLLAAGLVGGMIAISRRHQTSGQRRTTRFLVLWTGIHTAVLTFIPGKFSPYYLAPLVPGIAALIAITVDALQSSNESEHTNDERRNVAMLVGVLSLATGTVWVACQGIVPLTSAVVALVAVTAAAMSTHLESGPGRYPDSRPPSRRRNSPKSRLRAVSFVFTLIALIIAPARWTLAGVTHPQDPVAPSAALFGGAEPTAEQAMIHRNDRLILEYVQRHGSRRTFTIATSRVLVAALGVEQGIQTVIPLGGYFGTDPYPSLGIFTRWVRSGQLRWVAVPDIPPGRMMSTIPPSIVARPWGPYARANCHKVPPNSYNGIDLHRFWRKNNRLPLHAPLALFDCAEVGKRPPVQARSRPTPA